MNQLLERLIQDHKHMMRVHAVLRQEMAAFTDADKQPDLELLLDVMDYLRNYGDGFHHPLEDRAYARMRLTVGDAAVVKLLDHIELQHAWMRVLSRRLETHFEAIANGQITPLLRMLDDYRAYIDLAEDHIACENRSLLPAIERYLGPEHLQEILHEVDDVQDPLFLAKKQQAYQRLYQRIVQADAIAA